MLLGGYANLDPRYSGRHYRLAIENYVNRLARARIYVVLRLSGAAPANHAYGSDQISSDEVPMADADHSIAFWSLGGGDISRQPEGPVPHL